MESRARVVTLIVVAAALLAATGPSLASTPRSASPGAEDRLLAVDGRCPTFTWEAVPGASFSQLVVYRLPDALAGEAALAAELGAEDQALYAEVPGGAGAWTPPAEQCLQPGGRYVWFVRAVLDTSGDEVVAASEWSSGRYFAVPAGPTAEELARAVDVIRQWEAASGGGSLPRSPAAVANPVAAAAAEPTGKGGAVGPKSVTTAPAAVRGVNPQPDVEAYGVVGVASSATGAGVAAANTEGGPDLVLDGSLDGTTDLFLGEGGAWRSSPSDATFYLRNYGGGRHHLDVGGDVTGQVLAGTELVIDGATVVDPTGAWTGTGDMLPCSGCVTSSDLADESVTSAKIEFGGVTTSRIDFGAVTTDRISDLAVTGAKIGAAAVTNAKIASGAVDTAQLRTGAVTGDKILDGSVTMADLAVDSVGSPQIELGGVRSDDIDSGAVTTGHLADGAVTGAKIAADAVSAAHIADGAISAGDLAPSSVTSSAIQDGTITTADLADESVTSTKIELGGVQAAHLDPGAVTSAAIHDGTITAEDLALNAVTSDRIATAAVTTTKIQDGAVAMSKIAAGAVTETKIGTSAVSEAKIAAGAVTTLKIRDGAVAMSKIASGAVTAAKVDPTQVQLRVTGQCSDGTSIRTIGADGSVVCQAAGGDLTPPVTMSGSVSGGGALSVTNTSTTGTGVVARGGSAGLAARFEGNVVIANRDTGVTLIELGEGLDYAEGFDVSDAEALEPGTVLVIDPDAPGRLTRSRRAYDTGVAGIIAGANDLGSGVRLGAGGFDHDVALAGRVYCKVDASEHGVRPGDLLTTAATPGHAMKATDPESSRGAILGKAMEPLPQGEMAEILVLVTLQ